MLYLEITRYVIRQEKLCRVELHLSGLIGTTKHPDMQEIWISGFVFENRLHWQFEMEKKTFLQTAVLGHIFIYMRTKHLIHNSLYVFDNRGKNLSHMQM